MFTEQFPFSQQASCQMVRKRMIDDLFKMEGKYKAFHYRQGQLLGIYDIFNDITNEGKNRIFNVMFNDAVQIANNSWYKGLISSTGYSALSAADTMASHSGWTEFTAYTQANRVPWGSVTSTAQSVTNTTPCTFDINSSGTVKGLFIVSNNTKGGTSGVLWSTALFSSDVPVVNGDQIKSTYTLNG